jgi:hypothetical protein
VPDSEGLETIALVKSTGHALKGVPYRNKTLL